MRIVVDDVLFLKDMNNVIAYANGFLDGVNLGKPQLLDNLGQKIKFMVEEYIDSNARVDPSSLHHVYEWYQTGSPSARLFDIDYIVDNGSLSLSATLTQSQSFANGSKTPFYNKARIMESGVPVTIRPKQAQVLAFQVDGNDVFTRGPVVVNNPGGDVAGNFENVFRQFFSSYLSQSFIQSTGIGVQLKDTKAFHNNLAAGKRGGRSVGVRVGRSWIAKAGE